MYARWSCLGIVIVAMSSWTLSTNTAVTQDMDLSADDLRDPDRFDPQNDANEVRRSRRRAFHSAVPNAGINATQKRQQDDNCLWGKRVPRQGVAVGPTKMVYRDGYVLEHSSEAKVPYWVCEHSTKSELQGTLPRTNPFGPDPQLNGLPRAELADYRGSGFDRGHMCPNGDFKNDDQLRVETFFPSNIVPQVGKGFNQSIWAKLEDQVRTWTRSRDECWIITGSIYYDPAEDDPNTADGFVDITEIGDDKVQVPTHLYNIVIAQKAGTWESIAFVMENKAHPDNDFSKFIQSILWIEERTGFDFMPERTAATGDRTLEAKLEANSSPIWL